MHSDRVYWSLRAIDFVLFRLNQGLTCFHEPSEREFFSSLEESEIMEEKIEVSFIQENFEEKSIFQKRRKIWINWIMFLGNVRLVPGSSSKFWKQDGRDHDKFYINVRVPNARPVSSILTAHFSILISDLLPAPPKVYIQSDNLPARETFCKFNFFIWQFVQK